MQTYIQALWNLMLLLIVPDSLVSARSLDLLSENLKTTIGENGLLIGLVATASIICIIIVLIGCAEICQRQSGFKDFDNEDMFTTEVQTPPPVPSEFSMLPPVESIPDALSAAPIVFEPLPDPIQLRQTSNQAPNARQLRPKVAITTRDRTESEDSLEDIILTPDVTQDKLKLHNLIVNSRNQIPRSQLQYIKELGNAWFGKVLQGEGMKILPGHKKTKVVIQMLNEDCDISKQLAFLQEGMPYRDVDSPNVLRLLGQCVDIPPYLTILELCPFGDVKTYLRSHRIAMDSFDEKGLLLKFACDMAAGLQALNQQGYIHRDFAARNCLLASDLTVKVGDYGLSEEMYKDDYYVDAFGDAIPIRWLAPETMHCGPDGGVIIKYITRDSNIWSFGVSLWEIVTFGSLPYSDLNNDHVLLLVVKERSLKPNKPDVPVSHLDLLYQLMQLCWSEPGSRPSLRELRIMLLHLMSNKFSTNSTAFDKKWKLLMPRRPPQVAKVAPQPQLQVNSITANLEYTKPTANRPTNFESNFTELNPSLLGNAGSLESEEPDLAQHAADMTSPFNELSLQAEFSAANVEQTEKSCTESANDTPPRDLCMAYSPVESDIGDDVIEIHTNDDEKSGQDSNSTSGHDNVAFEPENAPIPEVGEQDCIISSADNNQQVTSPTTNLPIKPTDDLVTSTPVKEEDSTASSQQKTFFYTALQSQSSNEDEPSILGQRKFAACLQTVVTSFDGDELDPLSVSGSADDDIFRIAFPSIAENDEAKQAEKEEGVGVEERNGKEVVERKESDIEEVMGSEAEEMKRSIAEEVKGSAVDEMMGSIVEEMKSSIVEDVKMVNNGGIESGLQQQQVAAGVQECDKSVTESMEKMLSKSDIGESSISHLLKDEDKRGKEEECADESKYLTD